ncbi:MAG: hypothetical protein DDT29_02488 [Dehalococcoidia bacterium]|nr:hypothetical protein [Bacillota bacterium]
MRKPRIRDELLAQILAMVTRGRYYDFIVDELRTSTKTITRAKKWCVEASFNEVKGLLEKVGKQEVNDREVGPDDILKALRPNDYIRRLQKRLEYLEESLAASEGIAGKGDRMVLLVEFMRAIPLVQPDYGVEWLAETTRLTGQEIDPQEVYLKLLRGELPGYYEPPWHNHPVFSELSKALSDHPLLRRLKDFVDTVDSCVKECTGLLSSVYQDCVSEMAAQLHKDGGREAAQRHLHRNGWDFVFSIYSDALHWFSGRYLREASDQDYFVRDTWRAPKQAAWLCGADHTTFEGPLIGLFGLSSPEHTRVLVEIHLSLRRKYRASEHTQTLASRIARVRLLRSDLASALANLKSPETLG